MRVVLGGLVEEILTVRQMMLTGGSLGGERRFDAFGMRQLESSIDLIGGDVIESFAFEFLRQGLPIEFGSL